MRRVLPMMFACLALVGLAVFNAHNDKGEELAYLVPEATPITVDTLTQ